MSVRDLNSSALPDDGLTNSSIDVAVVLPTYNERPNIAEVIARVKSVLAGLSGLSIAAADGRCR